MNNFDLTPESAFAGLLREVAAYGDFVTIEQLFADYRHFATAGMGNLARPLIFASAQVHQLSSGFIVLGVTTQTEAYFEVYRRAFFDAVHAEEHGGLEVYQNPGQWRWVIEALRSFVEQHRDSLPASQRPKRDKVVGLFDRVG